MRDAVFSPERLLSLKSRGSAAYKGVYALMMQKGALDFGSGEPINQVTYFEEYVDIHHIFPKKWCDDNSVPSGVRDSIVNKTPLSYKTNRKIGGAAPSEYLKKLRKETKTDEIRQDEILKTHIVSSNALFEDDFPTHFDERAKEILKVIAAAMGKRIEVPDGFSLLAVNA